MADHRGHWLEVELKGDQRILGWAQYYSVDDVEKPELFLKDAILTRRGKDDTLERIDLGQSGVYLRNFDEIVFVRVIESDPTEVKETQQ
jgi:hypothetical protein